MVGQFTALIIIIALIVLAILGGIGWFVYMKIRYKTVPSNTALIITGPKLGDPEKESNIFQDDEGRYMKVIRGGGHRLRMFQTSTPVSLTAFQLKITTPTVYTLQGVPIVGEAVAMIKIADSLGGIAKYAEQFLGRKQKELEDDISEVLGSNLRAILSKMTVEQINNDRESFNEQVREIAQKQLDDMGFKITSLGLTDLRDVDDSDYLKNLGRPRTAEIRRIAEIEEASAESKDTDITEEYAPGGSYSFEVDPADYEPIDAHKDLNQEPVPVKMERIAEDEVNIEMTAQVTDIEIAPGIEYKTWNFNGEAPGPLLVVQEGDWINFTLHNMDPSIPHSVDFHAVHTDPGIGFADVEPNESGTFRFQASSPGVFMYHCATDPILSHIANGMHGAIIVMPKDGFPTDDEVDREFVILQNEWYKYNDLENMKNMPPRHVAFSAKTVEYMDGNEVDGYTFDGVNTNGTITSISENEPETILYAKPGEKIRMYINNLGPNEVSSFHVIGTIMEDVYIDGNPANHVEGLQTVMLPASGGAVVEFVLKDEGTYSFVTHQFNHVEKGGAGTIIVNETGGPEEE